MRKAKVLFRDPLSEAQQPRAQSEVIGVVFLTGIIVILVGFVGLNVLGALDTSTGPTSNLEAEVGASTVTLHHQGGDGLAASKTAVIFSDGGRTELGLEDFAEVQGDGDSQFEAGETWQHAHSKTDTIRIIVVNRDEKDTVVLDTSKDVPA